MKNYLICCSYHNLYLYPLYPLHQNHQSFSLHPQAEQVNPEIQSGQPSICKRSG